MVSTESPSRGWHSRLELPQEISTTQILYNAGLTHMAKNVSPSRDWTSAISCSTVSKQCLKLCDHKVAKNINIKKKTNFEILSNYLTRKFILKPRGEHFTCKNEFQLLVKDNNGSKQLMRTCFLEMKVIDVCYKLSQNTEIR